VRTEGNKRARPRKGDDWLARQAQLRLGRLRYARYSCSMLGTHPVRGLVLQSQLLSNLVWQVRMVQVKNQLAIRFVGGIKAGEVTICKPIASTKLPQHV
jgi:hypothetical protein